VWVIQLLCGSTLTCCDLVTSDVILKLASDLKSQLMCIIIDDVGHGRDVVVFLV
jgi:hypothetical protein